MMHDLFILIFFIPLSLKTTINVQLKLLVYNYNKQMSNFGRFFIKPWQVLQVSVMGTNDMPHLF